jgi:general secretion pathway protein G
MKTLPRTTVTAALRQGFSLAELMVVIVILGLLATLVVTNAGKFLGSGQKATIKANIATIEGALDSYMIEHGGQWPDTLDVLVQKDESGNSYIKGSRVPVDPWKNEYLYEPPSGGQEARIYTLGKDGQPGGEGDARDVDNIMIRNGEYD